jgi:hypothetical protein
MGETNEIKNELCCLLIIFGPEIWNLDLPFVLAVVIVVVVVSLSSAWRLSSFKQQIYQYWSTTIIQQSIQTIKQQATSNKQQATSNKHHESSLVFVGGISCSTVHVLWSGRL